METVNKRGYNRKLYNQRFQMILQAYDAGFLTREQAYDEIQKLNQELPDWIYEASDYTRRNYVERNKYKMIEFLDDDTETR